MNRMYTIYLRTHPSVLLDMDRLETNIEPRFSTTASKIEQVPQLFFDNHTAEMVIFVTNTTHQLQRASRRTQTAVQTR